MLDLTEQHSTKHQSQSSSAKRERADWKESALHPTGARQHSQDEDHRHREHPVPIQQRIGVQVLRAL